MCMNRWTACGLVLCSLLGPGLVHEVAGQACIAPPAGLVGWWSGNGTPVDAVTGAGAQLVGDATYQAGVVGSGFKLDGVGDYVEIADAAALKPAQVSAEAWVRFDALNTPAQSATPGLQYIVFKKNSRVFNFEGYALRKERVNGIDRFVFSVANVSGFGGVVTSTTPIVVGQFYHVVGSYDGSTVRLHVNGVLEGQASAGVGLDYGTRPVFLGSSGEAVYDGKLNGVIDEATVYSRALGASEVALLHAAGAGGKCAVQANVLPVFLRQPESATVIPGQTASLSVAATGTAPLTFQWYVGTSGGPSSLIDGATAHVYTAPATSAPTNYWVRVSNPVGTADSTTAVVTPLPTVGPPAGLYVKAVNANTVTLAWRDLPGQQAVTGHVLEGGLAGSVTPLVALETGSTAPTLVITVPNGSFWVQMRARAGTNLSTASAQIPLCLNAGCAPPSPTNLLGLANGTALSLGWRTPLEAGVPTNLVLQVTGALAGNLELPGNAEAFTFPAVPPGTYAFSLVSCSAAGCSAASAPVSLTFPGICTGPPATPAEFSAGKSGNTLVLAWGLPPSGSPPSSYVLNFTGAFSGSVPLAVRGVTAPVPSGTYTLTLAAANACGVSPPTSSITVTLP